MLIKSEIISALESSSLPHDSYWVLMGAALVLHGIKQETNDIDLGCKENLFHELIKNGYVPCISSSGKKRIDYSSTIHIYDDWNCSICSIEGINVATLDCIIENKKAFGRAKDIADIELINNWMNNNGLL